MSTTRVAPIFDRMATTLPSAGPHRGSIGQGPAIRTAAQGMLAAAIRRKIAQSVTVFNLYLFDIQLAC